jgi:hypothetical protein
MHVNNIVMYTAALLLLCQQGFRKLWRQALLPLLLQWMGHPGTKQHTSKVANACDVAHDARIARKIIMTTMRRTLIAVRVYSST